MDVYLLAILIHIFLAYHDTWLPLVGVCGLISLNAVPHVIRKIPATSRSSAVFWAVPLLQCQLRVCVCIYVCVSVRVSDVSVRFSVRQVILYHLRSRPAAPTPRGFHVSTARWQSRERRLVLRAAFSAPEIPRKRRSHFRISVSCFWPTVVRFLLGRCP